MPNNAPNIVPKSFLLFLKLPPVEGHARLRLSFRRTGQGGAEAVCVTGCAKGCAESYLFRRC
eukprot:9483033-Pyramimonas_sp.AAC.1